MAARRVFLVVVVLLVFAALAVAGIHQDVQQYRERIVHDPAQFNTDNWPRPRVAIVFGASVFGNGELSPILEDRVNTAIELYRTKKVDRILVSGDNRHPSYNEPKAMYDYLVSHAVDRRDILVDFSGRSTYETCLRAREVFKLERAILVTQQFHLPRALYIADHLGLEAVGVPGDIHIRNRVDSQLLRELAAEVKAYFEVHVMPPTASLQTANP